MSDSTETVQVMSVYCSPSVLKISDYGWAPCESARLDVYIDGKRYFIEIGTFHDGVAERRGLHVVGPVGIETELTSANSVSIFRLDFASSVPADYSWVTFSEISLIPGDHCRGESPQGPVVAVVKSVAWWVYAVHMLPFPIFRRIAGWTLQHGVELEIVYGSRDGD